jgi:hypothetical protein
MGRLRALTFAVGLAVCAGPLAAQQSVDSGSVSGRVTDPSGGVLPGAQVTARHLETNQAAAAVSSEVGRFRFPYLKVGTYEVTVHMDGFRDASRRLVLGAGSAFELPVALEVASAESVTVTGEATVLEAARSQIAATVSEDEVETLPLNGRNFLDLALLAPGVSPTSVGGTQLYPETSAVPGPGLSVSSQRNLSNSFIVDGLSANDDAAALSGITYSVDAVAEFQVVTSGGQAELGRALGGYFNVVTKSGTNTRQGDVYAYFRDDGLNAKNALSGTKLPMRQAQFGVSHGGPIVRDRTFYFVNVERKNLDQTGLVTVSQANVDAVNARLDAVGYQGPRLSTGTFPITIDTTHVLAKVDHQWSPRDRFTVRYSLYDLGAENARNAGGLNAVSTATGLQNTDQTLALANVFMISSRTVLESRAQLSHGDFAAPPNDLVGPAVSIAGVASFGTSSGNPTGRLNTLYQMVNNLSHQAGAHALRLGVDVLFNHDTVTYPRSFRGSYTFSSLASFRSGTYNNGGFTQTFGTSVITQDNPNLGVYAQDEWKVSPALTLNAGLRYDLQFLESIETDRNNVSPRVGFAWTPFASRRTVVRGGAGLFFDRVPLRAVANALLSAGNTADLTNLRQVGVTLSPTQARAPVFPNVLGDAVPSGALVNFTTMDPDLQNAHSAQASVEVEQQVGEKSTIAVGYDYLRGDELILSINQNVPACVASGSNNGCRPDPAYANNNQYSSEGRSSYHGVHVSFVQRPAAWGSYRVSYTLSTSKNNVGEAFFNSPIDPFDIEKDWARSDDDQRHRLVVHAAVNTSMEPARTGWERLTHGFELSGMLQYYSALPFNVTSGVTTVQGTAGRPVVDGAVIERNAGEGSHFVSLNARLSRTLRVGDRVRVEGLVEAFNLTNHRNVLTRNTNFGAGAYPGSPSPTFGQVTAVGEPRTVQLGARVHF